jgi:hypothetical protein
MDFFPPVGDEEGGFLAPTLEEERRGILERGVGRRTVGHGRTAVMDEAVAAVASGSEAANLGY